VTRPAATASGACFPKFGRASGAPIHGADPKDLAFYAERARENLKNPEKAQWHARDKALLDAIAAETKRQMPPDQGTAPPQPRKPVVTDVAPGETEAEAKARVAEEAKARGMQNAAVDVYPQALLLIQGAESPAKVHAVRKRAAGKVGATEEGLLDEAVRMRLDELSGRAPAEPGAEG
jgi:hypothetical protein